MIKRLIFGLIALSLCSQAFADAEDECAKKLVTSPGSSTSYSYLARVNGFAYSINLNRLPNFDRDDATLQRKVENLRGQLKAVEAEIKEKKHD